MRQALIDEKDGTSRTCGDAASTRWSRWTSPMMRMTTRRTWSSMAHPPLYMLRTATYCPQCRTPMFVYMLGCAAFHDAE